MTSGLVEATEYVVYSEHPNQIKDQILQLCERVFGSFDASYLATRLPTLAHPQLILAKREGEVVGFKLGYGRGRHLFYSWLGGVLPHARNAGIATELMLRQHRLLHELGYSFVETHTRASNNVMLIINLRHGFSIVGIENSFDGHVVVSQRKSLVPA